MLLMKMWTPNNCTPGHLSQRNEDLCSHRKGTQMFIATLFLIAPKWKQPDVLQWVNGNQTSTAINGIQFSNKK